MNLSQIRRDAAQRLRENRHDFSKLVLIHTSITAGVSLLLTLITWLSQYIAPEGGLSNMGTQTLLATGQTLLRLASIIIIPFWDAGLIFCALEKIQGRTHSPGMLTEGFHRFIPISISLIVRGISYFFLTVGSFMISSIFTSMLPLPPSVLEELSAFIEAPAFPMSENVQFFYQLCMVIWMGVFLILLIPKLFLHRLTAYRIMDDSSCNGLQAVLHSRLLMKGKRKKLLLLDLSFWWFYLLELVIMILSMGYLILTQFGITLPMNATIASWLFPIAALLLQLALYYYAKPKLIVTYAVFYRHVLEDNPKAPEQQKPQIPQRFPWNY